MPRFPESHSDPVTLASLQSLCAFMVTFCMNSFFFLGDADGVRDGVHLEQREMRLQVPRRSPTWESERRPRILEVAFQVFGVSLSSWLGIETVSHDDRFHAFP